MEFYSVIEFWKIDLNSWGILRLFLDPNKFNFLKNVLCNIALHLNFVLHIGADKFSLITAQEERDYHHNKDEHFL